MRRPQDVAVRGRLPPSKWLKSEFAERIPLSESNEIGFPDQHFENIGQQDTQQWSKTKGLRLKKSGLFKRSSSQMRLGRFSTLLKRYDLKISCSRIRRCSQWKKSLIGRRIKLMPEVWRTSSLLRAMFSVCIENKRGHNVWAIFMWNLITYNLCTHTVDFKW